MKECILPFTSVYVVRGVRRISAPVASLPVIPVYYRLVPSHLSVHIVSLSVVSVHALPHYPFSQYIIVSFPVTLVYTLPHSPVASVHPVPHSPLLQYNIVSFPVIVYTLSKNNSNTQMEKQYNLPLINNVFIKLFDINGGNLALRVITVIVKRIISGQINNVN